jgi:hypothetical protein
MAKEELAVAATFLVAEVRKEIAGSEQGEIYADYASMCSSLEDVKLDNRADTDVSNAEKRYCETQRPFLCVTFLSQRRLNF